MRVLGLNIPSSVWRLRSPELSKEGRHRLRILEWIELPPALEEINKTLRTWEEVYDMYRTSTRA